jgi:hypothetical protein
MTRAPQLFAVSVLLFVGVFSAAVAETYAWNAETHVTIQPTSKPGAVAEVVFANQNIHTLLSQTIELTLDGLTVSVLFERDVDYDASDRITVTPPPGYLAIPESLVVPENGAGVIHVYEDAIG